MRVIFVFLTLALSAATVRAQDAYIDRIDIVEAGLYSLEKMQTIEDQNTAAGYITPTTGQKNLELTTTPTARLGMSFGVRFVAQGAPTGRRIKITFVTRYPPQGLQNPQTGKTMYQSRFEWPVEIGKVDVRTYTFDKEWEAVPGE